MYFRIHRLALILALSPLHRAGAQAPKMDNGADIAAENYYHLELEGKWDEVHAMLSTAAQKRAGDVEKLRKSASKKTMVIDLQPGEFNGSSGKIRKFGEIQLAIVDMHATKEGETDRLLQRIMLITEDGKWKVLHACPSRINEVFDSVMMKMMAKFADIPTDK